MLTIEEMAENAKLAVLNPQRNPIKEHLDAYPDMTSCPPLLGIFNDIPVHKFRISEARAWARAGFSFVINDGEHGQAEGVYGREQNEILLSLGITPIQRLAREARSGHGDALAMGARGSMRPYACDVAEVEEYLNCMSFPKQPNPSPVARGAFPMKRGDGSGTWTCESLRKKEEQTMAWVQFETPELVLDPARRTSALKLMQNHSSGRAAVGFLGTFDVAIRSSDEELPQIEDGVAALCKEATDMGIPMGGVVAWFGDESQEEATTLIEAGIETGFRLITPKTLASELCLYGAEPIARPFHTAVARWNAKNASK